MAGYWVIRGNLRDAAALDEYAAKFKPIATRYEVSIIAGKDRSRTVEGPEYGRNLIIRFASYEAAVACYEDPEYQALLPLVGQAQERELVILEGA